MATTIHRPSTPPHDTQARTPQTPRWGAMGDDYQPYSPRKSARISQRSSTITTITPKATRYFSYSMSSDSPIMTSAPSSPPTAKKRVRDSIPEAGGRRVSGALTKDSASSAASALGLSPPQDHVKKAGQPSISTLRKNGMLITPAKTPKKRPENISPAVSGVARNLFSMHPSADEVMPTPKKSRKKHGGNSLGYEVEPESAPIQIYTDSQDRIPEADSSTDNPFYGKDLATQAEPTKRSTRRAQKVHVEGEGEVDIEDLKDREDGMLYMFRGKKMFRKFATDNDNAEENTDTDVMEPSLSPTYRGGRMTRSSVRPRLLFQSTESPKATKVESYNTEDEEADTDIEETSDVATPSSQIFDTNATPKAPRFAPFTPPTTVKTTRTKKVDAHGSGASDDEMTGMAISPLLRGSRVTGRDNPFAEWSRARTLPKESKKRSHDATSGGAIKKARA